MTPVLPAAGECHLWLAPVRSAGLRWEQLLDQADRRELARRRDEPGRGLLIASRAAQRLVVAHYLGSRPDAVVIRRRCPDCAADGHGRPRPMGVDVGFSVSHSRDWVIVAVSSSEPLGVDLECLDPLAEGDDLAEQVLTVAERRHYDGLPLADRRDWLYRAWTRKEAALKAAGHGLRIDPRQVEVGGPTTVVPGSCAAEAPMRLRLLDLSPVPGYLGALAWAGELEASVSYHQVCRLAPG